MKAGDLVRLKQPFAPVYGKAGAFQYGIVAGIIKGGPAASTAAATEVVLTLFDPVGQQVYTDETGAQALYSFTADEVDLVP